MNKRIYLNKLRKALEGMPQEMIEEIISDYQEHFEFGQLNGKSEDQISRELGHPKDVAKEYLGAKPKKMKKQAFSIAKALYFIIFLVGLFTILPHLLKATANVLWAIFIFILIIAGIGLVLGAVVIWYLKNRMNEMKNISWNWHSKNKGDVKEIKKVFWFDKDKIHNIRIKSVLENIVVKVDDVDQFKIQFDGESSFDYNHVVVSEEGDTLTINSIFQEPVESSHTQSVICSVLVPKDKTYNLNVDSALGNVTIEGSFNHLSVDGKTGNINVFGPSHQVDLDSKLGNINLTNFYGSGKISCKMGNASFIGSELLKGKMKISTKLGNFKNKGLTQIRQEGNTIIFDENHEFLDVSTAMGNIELK